MIYLLLFRFLLVFSIPTTHSFIFSSGFRWKAPPSQSNSIRRAQSSSSQTFSSSFPTTAIGTDFEAPTYKYVGGPHINTSIFCNVELNGANLQAVGFDMDFTLAQYTEAMSILYFEEAKHHLHNKFNYPREVLTFDFNLEKFCRGLIIDTKQGNILKTDRHKYVCVGYHGSTLLGSDERKAYAKQATSFKEKHFIHVDTFFSLVNTVLYNHLVEFRDQYAATNTKLNQTSYEKLYSDVKKAVDICHTDGYVKAMVMQNPSRYIMYDEGLVPLLRQLKESRKKVFLLTNSLWDYTNKVMDYLVHGGGKYADLHWEDLFDVIIVGANKPAFLRQEYLTMFKLYRNGELENVEDKEGLHPKVLSDHKLFQGGCWLDLHRLLSVVHGDSILYVGDHMYADILRSKKSVGWRTCLIIPELEHELTVATKETKLKRQMLESQRLQWELDEFIDLLKFYSHEKDELLYELFKAERKSKELKKQVAKVTGEYGAKFNKQWGQLFKAKSQDSRFAGQVLNYACLYTSRVTNLRYVSPNRAFRPVQDFMPHDRALYDHVIVNPTEED